MANARASKPATLTLELDFSTKAEAKKSMHRYASEIQAGITRDTDRTMEEIAREAGCSSQTIYNHLHAQVRNPQIRTLTGILFALGWEEISIIRPRKAASKRKAA